MKNFDLAFEVASQVIDMAHEIDRLRSENADLREYRRKYMELLNSDIEHNERMMVGLLDICLTPGVLPAMAKAKRGL